jgi:hypothetical protein
MGLGGLVTVHLGGMDVMISPDGGLLCPSHVLGCIWVKGCSLGDGRVWMSIEAEAGAFWLEIHVPMVALRGYAGF